MKKPPAHYVKDAVTAMTSVNDITKAVSHGVSGETVAQELRHVQRIAEENLGERLRGNEPPTTLDPAKARLLKVRPSSEKGKPSSPGDKSRT